MAMPSPWNIAMVIVLRLLLALLGFAAVCIGLLVMIYGPANAANSSEALFNALTGLDDRVTGAWPPTMDSELRFYAAFWGAYGLILIAAARNLGAMLRYVPLLAAVLFVGGAGRVLSCLLVGPPHPFFSLMMMIELVLPVVFLLLWFRLRSQFA
jgi:uncharacterized membrane protein